jgi:predicted RNase H-like nuclease (RuvC/YqgF family)
MENKYVRDSRSQAIQEVNHQALKEHRQRRNIVKQKEAKIKSLESNIDSLKDEMAEMKKMLVKLTKKDKKVNNE